MLTATATHVKTGVFLSAAWRNLAMLNFVVDPAILEPYVPAGTELDSWQGRTYVSVVGFQFLDLRTFGMPIPFHGRFEEVNLRCYVVRHTPDGPRRGVVFLREIAPKWMVSLGASWVYNEPFVTMPMHHHVAATSVVYDWQHAGRWNGLSVQFDGDPQAFTADTEEEFIAEHYFAYSRQRDGSTVEYEVEHPPWRIWPAQLMRYDCDVEAIYGKAFVPFLREPTSVFVADGSPVAVRRGVRLP